MNTREIIQQLSDRMQKPEDEIRMGLKQTIARLRKTFAREGSYTMMKFGSFFVHKREKKKAFHPIRKRYMLLPPKLVLRFRAAKALKMIVQEKGGE